MAAFAWSVAFIANFTSMHGSEYIIGTFHRPCCSYRNSTHLSFLASHKRRTMIIVSYKMKDSDHSMHPLIAAVFVCTLCRITLPCEPI